VLQIVDRDKLLNGPKEPTNENLLYPQVGRLDLQPTNGAHTTLPLLRMPLPEFSKDAQGAVGDFVMIVNEQIVNECRETRQRVWIADVTAEAMPFNVSNFNVPEASGNFCSRRPLRRSFAERKPAADVREAPGVRRLVQRGGACDRYPRSLQSEGSRYYIPAKTGKTDKRCVKMPTAPSAARSRSRPTTSKSTTAATSTSSIARTPDAHPAGDGRRARDREILRKPWPGRACSRGSTGCRRFLPAHALFSRGDDESRAQMFAMQHRLNTRERNSVLKLKVAAQLPRLGYAHRHH